MARARSALLALLALGFGPGLAAQAPVPKAPDLQSQEDAIIKLYRKGAKPRQPAPRGRLLPQELNTIRHFKEAKPSVVYISTLTDAINRHTGDVMRVPAGTGTGWVWDDKGHIVTNLHVVTVDEDQGKVVKESNDVRVTLANGRTYQARVIGRSLAYDTAVLQVFAPLEDLKPLPIGSSKDLEVGQSVIAIGNPFGLDHTLSTGVVSALNRVIPSDFNTEITGVVQTDAAINPGNSGGPLLDSAGRVIGMNTAASLSIARGVAGDQGSTMSAAVQVQNGGIGFAIPIDTLNRVVPLLIQREILLRPKMGFTVVQDPVAAKLGVTQGAAVESVEAGSPAARAGLRPMVVDDKSNVVSMGDLIIGVDGRRVANASNLFAYLEQAEPKDTVTFDVVRGDQIVKVTLDLRTESGKI